MFQLIIELILIGVALWAVNVYIPMQASIKKILNIVVVIIVVLWLLTLFGVFSSMGPLPQFPHHRY